MSHTRVVDGVVGVVDGVVGVVDGVQGVVDGMRRNGGWAGILPGVSSVISLAEDRDRAFEEALETLTQGSVVVLPVGGVYAIVADAFRPAATQRIFAARRRSRVTPIPVVVRSERQVGGLAGDVPEYADRLMAAFWPGELTLILPASVDLGWDLGNSKGSVQLRLPADELLTELIGAVGPLACTSANRLDQPRPTTVTAAKSMLGVLVPTYLDGGELDGHISTIVDATGPAPVVHREGVISTEDIHLVADGELPWGERPSHDEKPVTDEEPDTDEEPVTDEDPDTDEEPDTEDQHAAHEEPATDEGPATDEEEE